MNKIWNLLIYGYLVLAVVFIFEAISKWDTQREKSYMLFIFAITTVVLFFVKQKFRKKVRDKNNR